MIDKIVILPFDSEAPFEASLHLNEQTLTLSSMSTVISMSESREHLKSWPLCCCFLLFSLWGLKLFLFNFYLLSPQSLLFPIAESAGFHSTLFTSEESPNICIMTLSLSYLFLSGFCFWSSLLCFQSTSPPFNLILPPPPTLFIACSCWFAGMCARVPACVHFWWIMQNLSLWASLRMGEWVRVCRERGIKRCFFYSDDRQ